MYNALLDHDGELVAAVADMGIQEQLTAELLRTRAAVDDAVRHASVRRGTAECHQPVPRARADRAQRAR